MSFYLKDFMTWLSVLFLFYFWREKSLSPGFGVMVFFLDFVDFLNLLGRGTSQVFFFDKRPLNVGRRVEINLKLIHMASEFKTYTLGTMLRSLLFKKESVTWRFVESIGVWKI